MTGLSEKYYTFSNVEDNAQEFSCGSIIAFIADRLLFSVINLSVSHSCSAAHTFAGTVNFINPK